MPPSRQTIRYLQQQFQAAGLRPESRYGQNFLIDQNLLDILVEAAALTAEDLVLEVGTGTGALTARLAARGCHVVTVEIDDRLQQLAARELQAFDNVTMLLVDILKNKNTLQPRVLETLEEQRQRRGGVPFKLVANLPYHIATPLISNLLLIPAPPERMVITIQKELADRLLAEPCSKDYGALSVWMQSFCDMELLRLLSPTVFWPRPKVHSAMMLLKPHRDRLSARTDLREFHRFVRSVFLLRRKFLRSVLGSMYKESLGKGGIDALMASLALHPQIRAEQLSVDELDQLFRALHQRMQEVKGPF